MFIFFALSWFLNMISIKSGNIMTYDPEIKFMQAKYCKEVKLYFSLETQLGDDDFIKLNSPQNDKSFFGDAPFVSIFTLTDTQIMPKT